MYCFGVEGCMSDVQDLESRSGQRRPGLLCHNRILLLKVINVWEDTQSSVPGDPEVPTPCFRVGPKVVLASSPVRQSPLNLCRYSQLALGCEVDRVDAGPLRIRSRQAHQASTDERDPTIHVARRQLQFDLLIALGRVATLLDIVTEGLNDGRRETAGDLPRLSEKAHIIL